MPASLPEATKAQNLANPAAGRFVYFDLLSGPKGSPFDVKRISYAAGANTPTYTNDAANQNPSTGALSTGIGFGTGKDVASFVGPTAPASIIKAGFQDDYTVGVTVNTKAGGYVASPNSSIMYIGGGKSSIVAGTGANGNGAPAYMKVSVPAPYVAGFGVGGAGNLGSRDAGAGPAFTGFLNKMVTAVATVANGAAIEATWINRSGVNIVSGQSAFGSSNAASAAVA